MNNSVHVVFGAGALGAAVVNELVMQGEHVKLVSRSGNGNTAVPPNVETIACDAANQIKVAEICQDAKVVYNCIGLPYNQWNEFPTIMKGLLNGVGQTNATFVYADNLYAYGPVQGDIKESNPYKPIGTKTKIRADLAEMVTSAHKHGKIKAVIGRSADFFGPGVTSSILGTQVFEHLIQNKPVDILGSIDVPHTVTYIKDVAKALILLGRTEEALGESWHLPTLQTRTMRELIHIASDYLNIEVKYRIANRFLIHVLSLFNANMKEYKEIFYQFNKPFVMNDDKFKSAFQMELTPLQEAIKDTINWYIQEEKNKPLHVVQI
ncbi:nucleoside-diphosphate-sugar epimerase [Salirhabdus euzebyi]|uniref:Nucleoside-diphosphate-sugar epimerase n=1 Tax=Salirhabdus euzebyi TaxID=394506 RepID=A0A841Q4M6_9BACI|nr:NAD-dependent epimerase/dehydratase family protein [Salirhabdus euzebyi]MBB6453389.1 nucleoside-diphosphate-sugar epimerase [Salirhabdus euzebyi]